MLGIHGLLGSEMRVQEIEKIENVGGGGGAETESVVHNTDVNPITPCPSFMPNDLKKMATTLKTSKSNVKSTSNASPARCSVTASLLQYFQRE